VRAAHIAVFCRLLVWLMFFAATRALPASSGFLLGLDYSEWADPAARQIATDVYGNLYILSACTNSDLSSCVTKVSGDGKTILWRNALGFIAWAMAVDPSGGVYITPSGLYGQPFNAFVEKLSPDGTTVAWKTQIGVDSSSSSGVVYLLVLLAVDSTGRAFAAGYDTTAEEGFVVRLNTSGAIDYTEHVMGRPAAIAVDPTGSEVVVVLPGSVAWLVPDSGGKSYSYIYPTGTFTLAVAPGGDAVFYGSDSSGHAGVDRINAAGVVRFSVRIPGSFSNVASGSGLAVDAAGNVYITGSSGSAMLPAKNSLAPCGTAWLSVIAPDGSIPQTTYIPGAATTYASTVLIATGAGLTSVLVTPADPTVPPTRAGPFVSNYLANPNYAGKLFHLSPNPNAETLPLVCMANGASYSTGPIAPGEIVTLFGTGLGPQQGVSTQATLASPFPMQAANVEVTFDGKPGPLIWVQDAQINVTVPWSVAGPTSQVCVSYNNVNTNCLNWPVAQAAPGVVTVDGTHAAALNQDGSINSPMNPAKSGSIVSIFATGLGPISPPQADGVLVGMPLPVNQLPPVLGFACTSIPCGVLNVPGPEVVYGGPAPFLIAGASQINFRAAPGPLFLSLGTPTQTAGYSNTFQVYVSL
jgi:uncharacterized protein (TIGR03437 family)